MIVLWKSKQVAVEVDGPSHFLSGHRVHLATGATLLKHRQLRALGWHLVVVPYWEWHEVQGSNAKRHEYLLCLLRQAASDGLFQLAHPSGVEKMQGQGNRTIDEATKAECTATPQDMNQIHATESGSKLDQTMYTFLFW